MKKIICGILILTMSMCSGCVKKKVNSQDVRNYIVFNTEKLPDDLLMINNSDIKQQNLALAIFEGLVSMDSQGNIVPALASQWNISEDMLTYSFKIRENAKWSDGRRITAEDFVNYFSQILKKEDNRYIDELECIFGVKDYASGNVDFDEVAIYAKDNNTLEIKLNYPCNYFLEILSSPAFSLKENFHNLNFWKDEYKHIKYTGPFIIDNIYDNGEISLKKNPNYWDKEKVISNEIRIKCQKIDALALADYKSNDIDILTNIPISELNTLSSNEKIEKGPIFQGTSLNFNLTKDKITSKYYFRKAVSYAINKEEIANKLGGSIIKSSFLVPYNVKGISRNEEGLYKEDGDIKTILSQSEYNGEDIVLVYLNSNDINEKIASFIVKDLKEYGIKVISKGYDEEEIKEVIKKGDYHMSLVNYAGDYNSPYAFLKEWLSYSPYNTAGYNNNEFDSYLFKSKISFDKAESEKSLNEAERILLQDIACIPIGHYNVILCKKDYIKGLEVNKRGNIILKGVYIEDKTP